MEGKADSGCLAGEQSAVCQRTNEPQRPARGIAGTAVQRQQQLHMYTGLLCCQPLQCFSQHSLITLCCFSRLFQHICPLRNIRQQRVWQLELQDICVERDLRHFVIVIQL